MNQPAERSNATGRFDALLDLPAPLLTALAASFENGPLSETLTLAGIRGIVGESAGDVVAVLRELAAEGFRPAQIATLLRGLAAAAAATPKPSQLFDVVLSGPAVPGVPTSDTAAVMHTLLTHAEREVLLVGYAVYNGKKLFEPLADRMRDRPDLSVIMCLDIRRPPSDVRPATEVEASFARDFRERHWPWPQVPKLYYDPRSLETGPDRASLHAKCVIVDRSIALVTSANFTDAAQWKNVEAGVEIRHQPTVERLANYFGGLIRLSVFRELRLHA
jgi:phosphatidylserine/phosphatidylglycerophosphate/cardiolipin synthase-like enzyme